MVDRLGEAPPGTALVMQIDTGGLGLNVQAASVVVICEPQYKPSTVNQAIARAHRMGQARSPPSSRRSARGGHRAGA